jgi:hypothetical protein
MSKKTNVETTEKKTAVSLIGRGKLVRELAAKGVDLKEFTDVVQEQFPVCGDKWCAKHFKRAADRLAKKAAAQKPAPAPAPAPAPEKSTRKSKKSATKA